MSQQFLGSTRDWGGCGGLLPNRIYTEQQCLWLLKAMARLVQVSWGGSVLLVLMLLILAVPGLHCRTRAFFSWVHSFSRCRAWALGMQAQESWHPGLVALQHTESSHQGLNLCPLHHQADSQPPDHQGSPWISS